MGSVVLVATIVHAKPDRRAGRSDRLLLCSPLRPPLGIDGAPAGTAKIGDVAGTAFPFLLAAAVGGAAIDALVDIVERAESAASRSDAVAVATANATRPFAEAVDPSVKCSALMA